LKDANNVTLGMLVDVNFISPSGGNNREQATIRTPAGYFVVLNMDGTFPPAQTYHTGNTTCTNGAIYLNSGSNTVQGYVFGKTAFYSQARNTFMVPANVNGSGLAMAVSVPGAQSLENISGSCTTSSGTNNYGWLLTTTTRAAVGLPNTIALPISIQ